MINWATIDIFFHVSAHSLAIYNFTFSSLSLPSPHPSSTFDFSLWHLILASKAQLNGGVCLTLTQIFSAVERGSMFFCQISSLGLCILDYFLWLCLRDCIFWWEKRDGPLTSWCPEHRHSASDDSAISTNQTFKNSNKRKLYKTIIGDICLPQTSLTTQTFLIFRSNYRSM